MSALIGIVILALFCLALFAAIPFVLAPVVLAGMYLQRRRQLGARARGQQPAARTTTVANGQEETREAVGAIAQAA